MTLTQLYAHTLTLKMTAAQVGQYGALANGDGSKNATFKMNSRVFKLCRVYSSSLKLSAVGEFPCSRLLGDRTQV